MKHINLTIFLVASFAIFILVSLTVGISTAIAVGVYELCSVLFGRVGYARDIAYSLILIAIISLIAGGLYATYEKD